MPKHVKFILGNLLTGTCLSRSAWIALSDGLSLFHPRWRTEFSPNSCYKFSSVCTGWAHCLLNFHVVLNSWGDCIKAVQDSYSRACHNSYSRLSGPRSNSSLACQDSQRNLQACFFSMALQPIQGPDLFIFSQTVGLLGRVMSPSQGRYLNTGQHKQNKRIHTPNIRAVSGIRTHDRSVRAREDSYASDRAATATGNLQAYRLRNGKQTPPRPHVPEMVLASHAFPTS
jgi:hypothetical protein